jgi:hypothetical protein
VAYRLKLPDSTTIHPVFHVSLLKRAVGNHYQVSDVLLPDTDQMQIPVKVLQRRNLTRGNNLVAQVLVQWSAWPTSMAIWEDEEELRRRFPVAPAWDQAVSCGGEDVTKLIMTHQSAQDEKLQPRARRPNLNYTGPQWVG